MYGCVLFLFMASGTKVIIFFFHFSFYFGNMFVFNLNFHLVLVSFAHLCLILFVIWNGRRFVCIGVRERVSK